MKKLFLAATILLLAASCAKQPAQNNQNNQNQNNQQQQQPAFDGRLQITSPKEGDTIDQTFTITGKAQDWFEATIPVAVYDNRGNQLYKNSFMLNQDNYGHAVDFSNSITLTATATTQNGWIEFTNYSAKDGSVTYRRVVNVLFKTYNPNAQNLNTYTSPTKYGFEIKYANDFGFDTNYSHISSLGYIPFCDQTMLACVYLQREAYVGTNFDGAGVSLNVDPALNTQAKCYNFGVATSDAQNQTADVTINGVTFKSATGGQGAAGHFEKSQVYRNFHNNMCYEIAQRVMSTNIANYPTGTVKQFDENAVWQRLQDVVNTFTFTK